MKLTKKQLKELVKEAWKGPEQLENFWSSPEEDAENSMTVRFINDYLDQITQLIIHMHKTRVSPEARVQLMMAARTLRKTLKGITT